MCFDFSQFENAKCLVINCLSTINYVGFASISHTKVTDLETELNVLIFDVSEANGGEPFDTLSDALTYANNVLLDNQKKGGMTIKYVQSSDNNYVHYRLMSDTFNTTSANWQGVDDEPTAGSDNLVKSWGVKDAVNNLHQLIAPVGIDMFVSLGKRFLSGGYSNNSSYACSQKIICTNSNISFKDIPDGYQFSVFKYIDDTHGEQIRTWSDSNYSLTDYTGIIVLNFINDNVSALNSTDKAAIEQSFKVDAESSKSLGITKVDKIEGKGLSTNDYTNEEKTNVALIPEIIGDVSTLGSNVAQIKEQLDGTETNVWSLILGKRYIHTGYADNEKYACTQKLNISNHTIKITNVPSGYEFVVYKYVTDDSGSSVKSSYSGNDYESGLLDGQYIVTFIKNVGGSPTNLTSSDITAIEEGAKIVYEDASTTGLIGKVENHETRITALEQDGQKTIRDYFPIKNYFNLLQKKCPKFCKKVREKIGDVVVVLSGSSLSMGNRYASTREDATLRPPLLHTNDLASAVFDTIINQYPDQQYRRYDHSDISYVGTWNETNDLIIDGVHVWDDHSSIKNPLCKTTVTPQATVSINVPSNAWQFNFIYKTDTTCGSCTVSISEGNNKMEVWNGSAWIEANGYIFSMLETAAGGTKGNTCYQKRLKMRCKNKASGGIDSIGTAKTLTITKDNDDSRMNVVGFEWSPREFMFTLINGSRGGWQWGYPNANSSNLETVQDTDVWEFNPDLLLIEVTDINWGASRNTYMNRDPNFYVNLAKRAYFNEFEDNANSLYARSNGYTDCEVVFYGDTMHFVSEYRCFDDIGNPLYYDVTSAATNGSSVDTRFVGSKITAYDNYNIVDEYMLSKDNYIFIPVNQEFKKIAEKYYGSYFNAMTTGLGKTGAGLSSEGTHLNDNGAALWAALICPLFEL